MSILINGVEMPKTCGECRFSVDGWCYAFASNEKQPGYIRSDEKAKWCPLVEVPPHGRLGDLDKLEQMFVDIDNAPYSGFDGAEPFYSAEDAAQIIRLTPTIIEEEV